MFFLDMDHSVRELGVTDLGVPKKVKTMGNVFYGLAGTLDGALDSGRAEDVETVLVRNVYGSANGGAGQLATYLIGEAARLASAPTASLTGNAGAAV